MKNSGGFKVRVNLPRWGLKPDSVVKRFGYAVCKFTPLGFKTQRIAVQIWQFFRVNLPRWGLKHPSHCFSFIFLYGVNLPRWGLKQVLKPLIVCLSIV